MNHENGTRDTQIRKARFNMVKNKDSSGDGSTYNDNTSRPRMSTESY